MKKIFKYKAIDQLGKIQNGEISALSASEATLKLKGLKLTPMQVDEMSESERKNVTIGTTRERVYRLKLKEINLFCRQMSTMLSSGISLTRAIQIFLAQDMKPRQKDVFAEMLKRIKKGYSLSQSMKLTDGSFPSLLITMVESGERTGKIDEVLARMAGHYEKEMQINGKVKNATIYPIILGAVTVAAIAIIMLFVIPVFAQMFESGGMELPLITKMVIGVSNFVKAFWWLLLIIIIAAVVGIRGYAKSEGGRELFDSLKFRLPLIKKPMTMIYTARFTRTLSSLLASGVGLADSLVVAAKTTNNVIIEQKVEQLYTNIRKGQPMNSLFKTLHIFPQMMISMVGIGEETGKLDLMLDKTADYYEVELDEAIQKLLSLMEPAMIIVMGVIIGILVIAVMLPIFQMGHAVQ